MSSVFFLIACRTPTTVDTAPEDSGTTDTKTTTPDLIGTQTVTGVGIDEAVVSRHSEIKSLIYVGWQQKEPAKGYIEYSFDKGEWLQTPTRTFEAGTHEELLLGIPYETDATFRFVQDGSTSNDLQASTGNLPEHFPMPELLASDDTKWEQSGKYLWGSVSQAPGGWGTQGTYWKFFFDRKGRLVWAHGTPDQHWSIYVGISRDGDDLLWDKATYWADFDQGLGSEVYRTKIDLSVVESYSLPGLHHAFTELPDETLVWGAVDGSSEKLMRRNPDGSMDTIWDCAEFHDELGATNSCQSNSLWWYDKADTFLFSFYTTDTVVEIDHATGQTLWHAGVELSLSYGFNPSNTRFLWQHGVSYTKDGTLLLSTKADDLGTWETAAREYQIDHKTRTLNEVWSFGIGEGVYANTAGEAHRLANGNTLHNYGSAARVREVTDKGEIVWDLDWANGRLLGRTVWVEDLYAFAP